MKVKDLINCLQYIDPELDVVFTDHDGNCDNAFKFVGDCLLSPDNRIHIMSNHECLTTKDDFIYPMPKPIGYGLFENSIPYDTIVNTFYRCCLIKSQLGY